MAFFGLQFSLRAKILLHANWKPMQFVEFHLKIQEHRKWSEGNLSLHIFKWQNAEINLKKTPLISYARGSYFFSFSSNLPEIQDPLNKRNETILLLV